MAGRPDQGRAADHDRSRPLARQPGEDLEHRCRGAVHHRRARRRGRRLRPAERPGLGHPFDDRGRTLARHGLGGDPGLAEDALQCLGSALDADARLCRAAGAELPDRPERAQLPADCTVHPCRVAAERPAGNGDPARLRRRRRSDARLLAADDALGLRFFRAHGRRRPERCPLRRLRRLAHGVVDPPDQRRNGGSRRHPRSDEPARPDQSRLSLGLRLHCDHRLVPRPAASDRGLPRRPHPRRH